MDNNNSPSWGTYVGTGLAGAYGLFKGGGLLQVNAGTVWEEMWAKLGPAIVTASLCAAAGWATTQLCKIIYRLAVRAIAKLLKRNP
ncbi:hypothetical protein [Flaviaesturariibacter amylovorans]|uniref:DUF4235 domain-containing protein n=1 Tax=Flaviaesturariibacter amylovorans TaxID=1084520 RepID=A0ABP8GQY1_9BACT